MYDTYLPPFRAAVEAGTASFMAAFNALNGDAPTANPWLLTDVLREQWGFDGFVTSDWAASANSIDHGIAADGAEAARKAILAGVDMDMMGQLYIKHLPDEVRAGRVPEAWSTKPCGVCCAPSSASGLFDKPDIDPTHVDAVFPSPESRQAAREVARETFVLLQNRGDVLPIAPERPLHRGRRPPRRCAARPDRPARRRAGTRRTASRSSRASATAPQIAGIDVRHAAGLRPLLPQYRSAARRRSRRRKASDFVVAVFGEPQELSGEAASRAHLTLNGKQIEVLRGARSHRQAGRARDHRRPSARTGRSGRQASRRS